MRRAAVIVLAVVAFGVLVAFGRTSEAAGEIALGSIVLYSELTMVVQAEGQQHETHNFGRCTVLDHGPTPSNDPGRYEFLEDGSGPALRLPSGAAITFGQGSLLGPCSRLMDSQLLAFDREPARANPFKPISRRATLLEEGDTAHFKLAKLFSRRDRRFAVWLDNADAPTSIIGYLSDGLLNNPSAKFRLIDIGVRRLSGAEWTNREPTRIEPIIPWVAKYCPSHEKQALKEEDHSWQWQAPYTAIVPLADLPDSPWRQNLLSLSSGIHPLKIDEVESIAKLYDAMLRRTQSLHSFEWQGGDSLKLDLKKPLPGDVLVFYPSPPPYGIFGFRVLVGDRELTRARKNPDGTYYKNANGKYYDDGPYHYDAETRSIFQIGFSILFSANLCSEFRGAPQ